MATTTSNETISPFPFLRLPAELRNLVYEHVFMPSTDAYVAFETAWNKNKRAAVPTKRPSDRLASALAFHQSCALIRHESAKAWQGMRKHMGIHVRLTHRDDAKAFTDLLSRLAVQFPDTLIFTATIKLTGEHTHLLNEKVTDTWRLKRFELDIIGHSSSDRLLWHANIFAMHQAGRVALFRDQTFGELRLKGQVDVPKHRHRIEGYDGLVTRLIYGANRIDE